MREIEQIGDYSKGVVTSIDSIDIPKEACVLASNMEPIEGYLSPLKEPSTVTSTANRGLAITNHAFAVKDATNKSIVVQDSTKIKYNTYSTSNPFSADLTEAGTYTSTDMIPYNRDVRIGGDGVSSKIFRHSDFQYFGMREFSYTISKWNIDFAYDYNKLIFFRGTPTADMTVYVPLFAVDSQTTSIARTSGAYANELLILGAIDAFVGTKSLAVIYDDNTIADFDITDITDNEITISGSFAKTVLTCFVFAGTSYSNNPMVVTKIGSTYKAFNCDGAADAYTSIENGMYIKLAGSYEGGSSGTIALDRRLNFTANISIAPIYEDNILSNYADDTDTKVELSVASSGSSGYFVAGTSYTWYWTFVYDGSQESLLSYRFANDVPGAAKSTMTLTIELKDITALSRRITGINIYRKEIKDGVSTLTRLVTSIDLIRKDTGVPNSLIDWTNDYITLTYADTGSWGASYEAITGIPEELTYMTPYYKYGLIAYNRLLTIGNVITGEDELGKTLLISEPFRFDMFNWDTNQISLPSQPKGLGYFRDKVYVFGDNVIWKCNIETLAIEDIYMGYQLLDNRSILTTDLGMFFATTTGVFIADGTNIAEISYPIRDTNGVNSGIRSSCKAWNYNTTTSRVFLHYQQDKNQILIFDTYTETGWIYNLRYKSWWYIDFGNSSTLSSSAMIVDELGSMFYSTGTAIKKLFAGTNYAAFTWISKLFSNDTVSQKKTLYKVKHNSEGYSNSLTIYVDNGSSATLTVDSNGEVTNTKNVYKTLQLKFTSTSTATKRMIKDIELIYRRMKGLR